MIIDAHLHVWSQDVEKYPWKPIGGYIPEVSACFEEFVRQMEDAEIDKAVLVQPTPYGWDNSYLLDVCRGKEERFRSVVLVDPLNGLSGKQLGVLVEDGATGLRVNMNLLQKETLQSAAFFELMNTVQTLRVPVCLQITPDFLGLVGNLVRKFNEIIFVIDHMGRPKKGGKLQDPSFLQLLDLSLFKNVFLKLSGLNYYSDQQAPYKDTWPLLKTACTKFGADHCMWGSDFPFVNEHWSYTDNLNVMRNDLDFLPSDLEWILGKTAESIWWGG